MSLKRTVLSVLLIFMYASNGHTAPCEIDAWAILPEITEVRVKGEEIVLLTTTPMFEKPYAMNKDPTHFLAYLYDGKRQSFSQVTDKMARTRIMTFPESIRESILIPGNEFSYGGIKYQVQSDGIVIHDKDSTTTIELPDMPPKHPKREELKNISEDNVSWQGTIKMGILSDDWFIAGLDGGFPEGIGQPGGIAFFSLSQRTWSVEWDDLLYERVTSMIPLGNRILVTSVIPGEFGEYGGPVRIIDIGKKSVQPLVKTKGNNAFGELNTIEAYDAVIAGKQILVKGRYGTAILTSNLKVEKVFYWLKALSNNQVVDRLVEESVWLRWRGRDRSIFYAMGLLNPSDKVAFLEIVSKAEQPIWPDGDQYLPGPWGGCPVLDLPVEVLPYLAIEDLLLSRTNSLPVEIAIDLIHRSKDPKWLPLLKRFLVAGKITHDLAPKEAAERAIKELENLSNQVER